MYTLQRIHGSKNNKMQRKLLNLRCVLYYATLVLSALRC
jgi:hypothetical protein